LDIVVMYAQHNDHTPSTHDYCGSVCHSASSRYAHNPITRAGRVQLPCNAGMCLSQHVHGTATLRPLDTLFT
jgi:hypothetical protein